MKRIAITTSSFAQFSEEPLILLRRAGLEYVCNPFGRNLTEEETIGLLRGCVGVAAGTEPLTARVIAELPELKVISRCGAGMDNVDIAAAAKKGIKLCSTPDGPTLAVAELTLAFALDLLRKVTQMDRGLRGGAWKKQMGNTLKGKKLGIIGFGRIGQAVAAIFTALGADIAFNDPVVDSTIYRKMSISELLSWADIISLHSSRSGGECSLLAIDQLRKMKPGSWIINAARGGLVDEGALYDLLKSGHLAGAAIDVFEREPYDGPLKDLDNVILTPHIGSYARESRIQMEIDTIKNLINCLNE
ncbi:MAG: hydroxyacid dehydrogenase [Deltaproteobacteria bacterium HGW-Deltaproteobacteria-12]|jgi:D-3-phosphoglycerate dehydrogenase|nr:MAG: hydroxyacid dehydrogenase [Deltaproteobacteria bacterium HGW-Deltaproteobacteria-12]